jgi:hypothetical protein
MIVTKLQNAATRSDYCCILPAEWNFLIKTTLLFINSGKHYFDRDLAQSVAMLINYLAQGLPCKWAKNK